VPKRIKGFSVSGQAGDEVDHDGLTSAIRAALIASSAV
jgi:hypothetical protein